MPGEVPEVRDVPAGESLRRGRAVRGNFSRSGFWGSDGNFSRSGFLAAPAPYASAALSLARSFSSITTFTSPSFARTVMRSGTRPSFVSR